MTPNEVLAVPMAENDAGASTIGEYLKALLAKVWEEEECFSGKRPFGNSGWKHEVYCALVEARAVRGRISEEDGNRDVECADTPTAEKLIVDAIAALSFGDPTPTT